MKKYSVMVKQVLMSTLTAVMIAVPFTSCSDEMEVEAQAPAAAQATTVGDEPKDAVGLIYNDFITPEDIKILNADTTKISISRALAQKKGIDNFVNRPMGIWLNFRERAFLRRGTKQQLDGDRYIIDVVEADIAEVLPQGKDINLKTDLYMNTEAVEQTATRGIGDKQISQVMEDMSIDEEGYFHPVAVQFNDETLTRSGVNTSINYSPYELLMADQQGAKTRGIGDWFKKIGETIWDGAKRTFKMVFDPFGVNEAFLNLIVDGNKPGNFLEGVNYKSTLTLKKDIKVGDTAADTVSIRLKLPIECKLNYTLNIKPAGSKLNPKLAYLRACLDGDFKTSPEVTVGFCKTIQLPKDKQKIKITDLPGKSFTFTVYGVPVVIDLKPNVYMKLKLKGEGYLYTGVKYDFAAKVRVGAEYKDGKWNNLTGGEITKSSYKFTPMAVSFKADAGIGFMVGCDVMLYKAAGPYVAVGPQLAADAALKIAPFEDEKVTFSTNGKIGVWGEAGAKVEIWKWHICDYYKEFEFGLTKKLWTYPDKDKKQTGAISELVEMFRKKIEDGLRNGQYNNQNK